MLAEAVKKEAPKTLIIAGGPHSSALAEKTLEKTRCIDAVVVGEGERTILEVMKRVYNSLGPFEGVNGVIYRDGNLIKEHDN